jgi:hypothetical protein
MFVVTRAGEAVFIPTGWPHATYSMENCCTYTITWAPSTGLERCTDLMSRDIRKCYCRYQHQCEPWLDSVLEALRASNYNEARTALQAACKFSAQSIDLNALPVKRGEMQPVRQAVEDIRRLMDQRHNEDPSFWSCSNDRCTRLADHLPLVDSRKRKALPGESGDQARVTRSRPRLTRRCVSNRHPI